MAEFFKNRNETDLSRLGEPILGNPVIHSKSINVASAYVTAIKTALETAYSTTNVKPQGFFVSNDGKALSATNYVIGIATNSLGQTQPNSFQDEPLNNCYEIFNLEAGQRHLVLLAKPNEAVVEGGKVYLTKEGLATAVATDTIELKGARFVASYQDNAPLTFVLDSGLLASVIEIGINY